jgi:cytochrome c553
MKMNRTKIQSLLLAATLVVTLSPTSVSAGDIEAGKTKSVICLTCHKTSNEVVGAGTPIISGQYEDYLIQALKDYKSGARSNPVMGAFTVSLSDEDIEDIAEFYAAIDSQLFTPTE